MVEEAPTVAELTDDGAMIREAAGASTHATAPNMKAPDTRYNEM